MASTGCVAHRPRLLVLLASGVIIRVAAYSRASNGCSRLVLCMAHSSAYASVQLRVWRDRRFLSKSIGHLQEAWCACQRGCTTGLQWRSDASPGRCSSARVAALCGALPCRWRTGCRSEQPHRLRYLRQSHICSMQAGCRHGLQLLILKQQLHYQGCTRVLPSQRLCSSCLDSVGRAMLAPFNALPPVILASLSSPLASNRRLLASRLAVASGAGTCTELITAPPLIETRVRTACSEPTCCNQGAAPDLQAVSYSPDV